MAWSADGAAIATASEDRAVRIFSLPDLTSRNVNIKRKALLRAPVDVCFGSDTEQLLVLTKGECTVYAHGCHQSLVTKTIFRSVASSQISHTWPQ